MTDSEEEIRQAARRGFERSEHARLAAVVGERTARELETIVALHSTDGLVDRFEVLRLMMDVYRIGQSHPAGPVYTRAQITDGSGFRRGTRFVDIGPGKTPDLGAAVEKRPVHAGLFHDHSCFYIVKGPCRKW